MNDNRKSAEVYFDGSSRGNPGPSSIGWVLLTNGETLDENCERIGKKTNNQAEYLALKKGVYEASQRDFDELMVYGDSELIVKQIQGEYSTNSTSLRAHKENVMQILQQFDVWSIRHVPRGKNARADELANMAFEN